MEQDRSSRLRHRNGVGTIAIASAPGTGMCMWRLTGFRRDLFGPWQPTHGCIRNQQHTFPAPYHKLGIGCQVRQQFTIVIFGIDFDGVSDNILRHGRIESNFADLTLEHLIGKRVHFELNRLVLRNVSYVGFIDRYPKPGCA